MDAHPDGLGSDDAVHVLRSSARSAAGWYGPLDPDTLLLALTGALGVTDPDEPPPASGTEVVMHGILLIADQLRVLAGDLSPVLEGALRELRRAQTTELP